MKAWRAFTSLEMIVVLGLVMAIYLLITPAFRPSQQAIVEEQFWHSMRQNWRSAQIAAQLQHQSTIINYRPATQQIEFDRAGNKTFLDIPATMEEKEFGEVCIDASGYTAPQTIRFKSNLSQQYYLMKIQLAWGGYRLEKTR